MNQFTDLSLSSSIQSNLKRNNLIKPTPVQAQAVPAALTGADVVATAQTGTGKTLAFLLPTVERLLAATDGQPTPFQTRKGNVRVLVLTPTRELAMQIAETAAMLSEGTPIRSAIAVGGQNEQAQLNQIRRGAQILIATPGRLNDYLDRKLVDLSNVQTLILDEADRMLSMGFIEAIEGILAILPPSRQTLFFSATIDKGVERLITRYSKDPIRVAIGGGASRTADQVDLHFYEVEERMKVDLLLHMLGCEEGSFLVFARTKHGTDRLAKKLAAAGVKAVAMHGDRTQNQRNQALAGFRDGRYRVLVATDVAARGIHVDSVAHVVNYDLPQAPEDFIHRVGRTGRAGQRGCASTFGARGELKEVRRIEKECRINFLRREIAAPVFTAHREREALAPKTQVGPIADHKPHNRHFRTGENPFSAPSKRAMGPKSGKPFGGSRRGKGKPNRSRFVA